MKRLLKGILGALMAALMGALGLTLLCAVARQQPTTLPAPTGRHSVGVASLHWSDAGRVAPAGQGGRRRIDLTVFYPALPGGSPAQYMDREVARARVAEHGAAWAFFSDPASIHPTARIGPAPWQVSRVIVFLPGAGQSVAEYSSLLEDQASNGVVVLAVDPAGNTPASDGNGGVVPANPEVYSAPEDPAGLVTWGDRIVADWGADVTYVVGRANAHPGEIPGLSQRFHPAGVVGHSIGGAAALEACASMSGCPFAADLDGWVFGAVTRRAIHRPLLFVSSPVTGCDDACQGAQQRHQAILHSATPPAIDHTLPGFAHLDFTDHAVEFDPMLHLLGLLGSSNGVSAVRTVRAELRAFENTYLPSE